jgi:hypothetical protein
MSRTGEGGEGGAAGVAKGTRGAAPVVSVVFEPVRGRDERREVGVDKGLVIIRRGVYVKRRVGNMMAVAKVVADGDGAVRGLADRDGKLLLTKDRLVVSLGYMSRSLCVPACRRKTMNSLSFLGSSPLMLGLLQHVFNISYLRSSLDTQCPLRLIFSYAGQCSATSPRAGD